MRSRERYGFSNRIKVGGMVEELLSPTVLGEALAFKLHQAPAFHTAKPTRHERGQVPQMCHVLAEQHRAQLNAATTCEQRRQPIKKLIERALFADYLIMQFGLRGVDRNPPDDGRSKSR